MAIRIKSFISPHIAALGSCPKCGYGFAGKKPDSSSPGKMVKMDVSDPKYDPTKPCPHCELGLDKGEDKDSQTKGFGEKYYVHNKQTDMGYVGPFYQKSDAQAMKDELDTDDKEAVKWADWLDCSNDPHYEWKIVTEKQMHDQEAQRAKGYIEFAQNQGIDDPEILNNWRNATPAILSPKDARNSSKHTVDYAKRQYYQNQKSKEPNTSSLKSFTKEAQANSPTFPGSFDTAPGVNEMRPSELKLPEGWTSDMYTPQSDSGGGSSGGGPRGNGGNSTSTTMGRPPTQEQLYQLLSRQKQNMTREKFQKLTQHMSGDPTLVQLIAELADEDMIRLANGE